MSDTGLGEKFTHYLYRRSESSDTSGHVEVDWDKEGSNLATAQYFARLLLKKFRDANFGSINILQFASEPENAVIGCIHITEQRARLRVAFEISTKLHKDEAKVLLEQASFLARKPGE